MWGEEWVRHKGKKELVSECGLADYDTVTVETLGGVITDRGVWVVEWVEQIGKNELVRELVCRL